VIGDRVWIGPDTVVYGAITVGDGVAIRGLTMLGKNVPSNCLVGGKPGRFERRDYDNSTLLCDPDAHPSHDKADAVIIFSSDKGRFGNDE
jgi:serine acetyltransferase